MAENPQHLKDLGHLMALNRAVTWVDRYPVEERLGPLTTTTADKAVIVDVGGGFGQQAVLFRKTFPHLRGRVIVQDTSNTLAFVKPIEGIEFVQHDFFQPQPIKDARIYYIRNVLHDWPDAECVQILRGIIPAMGKDSRIVIDEAVVPERDAPWQVAHMDLLMMCCFGSGERTRPQWEALLERAGLEVVEVFEFEPLSAHSVIVARPGESAK